MAHDLGDNFVNVACGDPQAIRQPAPSKRFALMVIAGLTAIYLVSVFFTPPAPRPDGQYFTICGFKNFTGLPCPGCGLAHSFCALGKADLASAFAFNLMGPPLFLLSLVIWLRSLCVITDRNGAARRLDKVVARLRPIRTFAICFAVFGTARVIYVLVNYPETFRESSFARLIARLFG